VETLHPVEMRVLGALLEKDITTPEYYPLTLNALVNACNQKSSRDPVVNYDEDTVLQALTLLREKGLALKITGAGHRVEKYSHRLGESLNLGRREIALLCVLMLRGPQTVGELRGRTERMHDFADLDEVERCLESLATREPDPLVARASRGRWMQLLGATPEASSEADAIPPREDRSALDERVAALEREVESLKQQFEGFRRQFE
jgi:uncharacterized protein YceH (UPF0502 family)